jgi:hypothetical protein
MTGWSKQALVAEFAESNEFVAREYGIEPFENVAQITCEPKTGEAVFSMEAVFSAELPALVASIAAAIPRQERRSSASLRGDLVHEWCSFARLGNRPVAGSSGNEYTRARA